MKQDIQTLSKTYTNNDKLITVQNQQKIAEVLKKHLINEEIKRYTYFELPLVLRAVIGEEVEGLIIRTLLLPPETFQEVYSKNSNKKFLLSIYQEFSKKMQEARALFEQPERWRLVTTQLHNRLDEGAYFRTRLVRYDNQSFVFESLAQDYLILIHHLLDHLKKIRAEPANKFAEEMDKIITTAKQVKDNILSANKNER